MRATIAPAEEDYNPRISIDQKNNGGDLPLRMPLVEASGSSQSSLKKKKNETRDMGLFGTIDDDSALYQPYQDPSIDQT